MESTYWEHNGRFQTIYNDLYAKLIPDMGEADTPHGEALRAMSGIYYDLFNNGWINFNGDRFDTLKKFLRNSPKLSKTLKRVRSHYSKVAKKHNSYGKQYPFKDASLCRDIELLCDGVIMLVHVYEHIETVDYKYLYKVRT